MTKRLFNPDLDNGVVCDPGAYWPRSGAIYDPRASLPRSGFCRSLYQRSSLFQSGVVEMAIKGFLYFNLELLKWQSKVFPISMWTVEMAIKGLLYSNLELLKCRSKVFSTSIWTCWSVDQMSSLLRSGHQRSFLLQSRLVEVSIKGLLYFDLDLLKCWSKVFSPLIRTIEMLIKGLFYFDLDCWNGDQRSSLLQFEVFDMSIKGFLYFDLEFVEMLIQGFSTSI